MTVYEYKVVAAPNKGLKGKGIKGDEARFANALATVMNDLGSQGWEYQRSDTLPCEKRSGFRGHKTVFQNMLVFRRQIPAIEEVVEIERVAEAAADIKEVAIDAPAPLEANTAVETKKNSHAPLLNGTHFEDTGGAPNLGSPSNEAREVQDPRLEDHQ